MAKVSVIIPVYNIEEHLSKCLDSIVEQSLSDLEIICVDDGSTDKSLHILSEYENRDQRFTIVTQKNAGPGIARNYGFAVATGEYVIFLDSDDYFEPDFLEKMVAVIENTNSDIVICQAVEFDTHSGKEYSAEWMLKKNYLPALEFSPREISEYLFQFTYGMAWDKLYRRDWLISTGILFPALRNSEDLAFVFPTLLAARKIAVLPEAFIHHRINRLTSVSNTRREQPDAPYEALQIVEKYLNDCGWMEIYQQSFMNWAMEFLVWHVCNISDREIQNHYLEIIRTKWFPKLGFEKYPITYYRDKRQLSKYLLAKYAPKLVFYFVLRIYKFLKRKE